MPRDRTMTTVELTHESHSRGTLPLTAGELLDEIVPLVGVIPVAGPPVVLLAIPWLFIGMMLAAPFAVLLAIVVVMVAAAALVALTVAILASPYLLVRGL